MFNLLLVPCLISHQIPSHTHKESTLQLSRPCHCHDAHLHDFPCLEMFSWQIQWSWPSSWTVGSAAQMAGCMLEQQAELKQGSYTGAELRFIVSSKTRTLYCPLSICSATAAVSLYLLGHESGKKKIMTIKHPYICAFRKVFGASSLRWAEGGCARIARVRAKLRPMDERWYEYWTEHFSTC